MLKPLVELALRMDGLSYYGKITAYTDTTHFKIDGLKGWQDGFFYNWFVYVVRDSGGIGAAPQDELAKITNYTSSDGTFTHLAFTTPVAVGDEVLIVHKSVAAALADGGGGYSGDIEIWDSYEYPSDSTLQSKWTHSGGAAAPVRENAPPSGAPYYENYCMEAPITGIGVGEIHRNFAVPKDIGTLRNISIAGQSDNALDTFRFMLIDSSGNDSYWTQTCTLADTWYNFDIDPHSLPSGTVSGTSVDLDDVVQIRLANMTNGSTYYFDLIIFESLVASTIGLGYDGLSDTVGTTSSVRGHLLQAQNNISDVFDIVNAILTLTETGGVLTTTGAVQTVYINNAPAGVFEPRTMQIDFSNHAAADTIVIRSYYRIASGGGWIKDDEESIIGVQDPALITIDFKPNRFGYYVTMETTAGANHDYLWEVSYKA